MCGRSCQYAIAPEAGGTISMDVVYSETVFPITGNSDSFRMGSPGLQAGAMTFDPDKHHRRSIRLPGFDYSQEGMYFVTICTKDRRDLFGDVYDGKMNVNPAGNMLQMVWDEMPVHYPGIKTDAFGIMPNHIHAIIILVGAAPRGRPEMIPIQPSGQPQRVAPTISLSDAVHRFKSMTTKRYLDGIKHHGWVPFLGKLWQRNYYKHIIQDVESFQTIREYIIQNPMRWESDPNYLKWH